MRCQDCRKVKSELNSTWDNIRLWFFNLHHEDIIDLSQDKFTQGYSDGYKAGMEKQKELQEQRKEDLKIQVIMDIKTGADKKLKNELLASVLNSPNPDLVLTVNEKNGLIYLNGNQISDAELFNLNEEIKALETWRVWGILHNTLSDMARKTMNEKATSFDDMMSGKLILYTLDIQKSILNAIKNLTEFKKKKNIAEHATKNP